MGEQSKLALRKALTSFATEYVDVLLFEDGSISAITKRSNMRSMIIFIFESVLFRDYDKIDGPYTYKVKVDGNRKEVALDPDTESNANLLVHMSDFTIRIYGAEAYLRDIVHSVRPVGYDGGDSVDWELRMDRVHNMIGHAYEWLENDMP